MTCRPTKGHELQPSCTDYSWLQVILVQVTGGYAELTMSIIMFQSVNKEHAMDPGCPCSYFLLVGAYLAECGLDR